MSVELLDKTRKINQLLRDNRVSKVAFTDLCRLLGELLESSVYVISNKGKILGINQMPDDTPHSFFPSSKGQYMDAKMAKRFLDKRKCESGVYGIPSGSGRRNSGNDCTGIHSREAARDIVLGKKNPVLWYRRYYFDRV